MPWPALLASLLFQGPARPPIWQLVERMAAESGQADEMRAVLEHMAGVPGAEKEAPPCLARVRQGLAQPWSVPATSAELRDLLAAPLERGGPGFDTLPDAIAPWLDLEPGTPEADSLQRMDQLWTALQDPELVQEALLQRLSEYLENAHRSLETPTPAEKEILFEHTEDFLESWYRSHFPGAELPQEQAARMEASLELYAAMKTDRRRLLAVATRLLRLTDREFLDGLSKRLERTPRSEDIPEGYSGDVLACAGSAPHNQVVLGGPGKTEYALPAALVLDLGGNDVYRVAASADRWDCLASVVLDWKGNDSYEKAAVAAGGVAVLLDRQGKDHYEGKRFTQAAACSGFALLADLQGDDVYRAEDFALGYALCGLALLYDAAGDDDYSAWAYAQGAGNGPGLGALVDGGGNDRYVADGHWPDVYGDSGPESFHGASQGYSSGIRPRLPGGIAACLDLGEGEDFYQSGNFSQGGGYYFALGLLYDAGGDDENHGYRYSQGFGVHQAVGLRWDAGGNDRYVTRSVASLGMAWDEGVGWFLDDAGDDQYDSGGLALGAAAQTAVAVFVDGGGADRYQSAGDAECQGGSGGSEYHGKPALGVLIDFGGGKDSYSRPGREDGALLGTPGCGLFLDCREKTLERVLARRSLSPR